ncbi:MAG: septum formation initiator family protein [Candidatus Paceibacterota bacterium]
MLEREFQKRRKIRNRIYSKTTVVVLLIVILIMTRATWRVYKTKIESRKDFEKVSSELESMRAREAELKYEIDRLNTNKGTEEEIRKKFNVAKDGEGVVYVVDSKESEENEPIEASFIQKIWKRVGDIF